MTKAESKPDHDIIIVGAGIAGCYLTEKLTEAGLDVLVLEKEKSKLKSRSEGTETRLKDDSGIVSTHIEKFIPDYKKFLTDKIKEMRFESPSHHEFCLKSEQPFAYLLDRTKLIKEKRKSIKSVLSYETPESIIITKDKVMVKTNENWHMASMIIGCDGAFSKVRNAMRVPSPKICYGVTAKSKSKNDKITVYVNKNFSPDFFSWNIPQRNEWGMITAKNPKDYFLKFMAEMKLEKKQPTGQPIPIGTTKSFANRCLLVGDSAGMTKPLTGGGWIFSLRACEHAARVIAGCLEKNRFDASVLSEYEKSWKNDFGNEIRKQLFARRLYEKLNNKDIDKLFKEFGPRIEKLNDFDYDNLSILLKHMPKTKLLGLAMRKLI